MNAAILANLQRIVSGLRGRAEAEYQRGYRLRCVLRERRKEPLRWFLALRDSGKTYREIGIAAGVSAHRARCLCLEAASMRAHGALS
jgi:hypothetical protein